MLNGFDTSHWNGLVQTAGAAFWFGKVTQGTTFVDPEFQTERQWLEANSPSMVRFGYHYCGFTSDATAEANFFLSTFGIQPGEGTMIDIEDPTITGQSLVDWCVTLAQTILNATGKAPLAYMDQSLQNAYDWSPLFAICGNYLSAPDVAVTANADTPYQYVFQQTGTVNGVDQDVFFGTEAELQKYATDIPAPTPPSEPPVAAPTEPAPSPVPPPVTPTPSPSPTPPKVGFWQSLLNFLKKLIP